MAICNHKKIYKIVKIDLKFSNKSIYIDLNGKLLRKPYFIGMRNSSDRNT